PYLLQRCPPDVSIIEEPLGVRIRPHPAGISFAETLQNPASRLLEGTVFRSSQERPRASRKRSTVRFGKGFSFVLEGRGWKRRLCHSLNRVGASFRVVEVNAAKMACRQGSCLRT